MAIVKPFKLYMCYAIFMALYHVLISMIISTFKVCREIPCGGLLFLNNHSRFSFISQVIRVASEVSGFCMVWVFTVNKIQADYCFDCFDINKLLGYTIIRKNSCTTDLLLVSYLDAG